MKIRKFFHHDNVISHSTFLRNFLSLLFKKRPRLKCAWTLCSNNGVREEEIVNWNLKLHNKWIQITGERQEKNSTNRKLFAANDFEIAWKTEKKIRTFCFHLRSNSNERLCKGARIKLILNSDRSLRCDLCQSLKLSRAIRWTSLLLISLLISRES